MLKYKNKIFNLKSLILGLTILSALIALGNTFNAAYSVQRQQLIDASKNGNFIYANKLAKSTNDFLDSAQQQLSVSASIIAKNINNTERLNEEVDRLRTQTKSFNSVLIINSNAEVIATSPNTLSLTGKTLSTEGVVNSLKTKKPTISNQYLSTAGNLLIFITHPIFDNNKNHIGMVGGSIYLKQESILDNLLGKHFYSDGSYLYVVDKNKKIIYHPEQERIGETISGNEVIDDLSNGQSGSKQFQNSKGIEMIAGYASIPTTEWGVVSQRPVSAILAPLESLMNQIFIKILPTAFISILLIWWCAIRISRPLKLLANGAHSMDAPETESKIRSIKSWYFEAQELKKAMLLGISLLNLSIKKLKEDVQTDPLTQLGNRRSLDTAVQNLSNNRQGFSLISIDIDHFKKINDTHGHNAGDIVLYELAAHIKKISRINDIACRVGGEEFLIILPKSDKKSALHAAERLRAQVEEASFHAVEKITISIGVANWPTDSNDIKNVFLLADEMLYKAKMNGRNRVEIFGDD